MIVIRKGIMEVRTVTRERKEEERDGAEGGALQVIFQLL